MKTNIAYSAFWGLWLGFQQAKFQVIPGLMWTFLTQPEPYILWCPVKSWQDSACLWFFLDSPRPRILDIWPSVGVVYWMCHFPFLRLEVGVGVREAGVLIFAPRQDQSMVNICVSSEDNWLLLVATKGEPIICLICVCSHPSSNALCYSLGITFLFLPVIPGSGRKPLMG